MLFYLLAAIVLLGVYEIFNISNQNKIGLKKAIKLIESESFLIGINKAVENERALIEDLLRGVADAGFLEPTCCLETASSNQDFCLVLDIDNKSIIESSIDLLNKRYSQTKHPDLYLYKGNKHMEFLFKRESQNRINALFKYAVKSSINEAFKSRYPNN